LATSIEAASARGVGIDRIARWAVALREFLRSPSLVGSAFPASQHLIDALLAPFDWSTIRTVVEYGPGTGPITRAALARMQPDSRLLAIDVSAGFTRYLRQSIEDERLLAVRASAEEVESLLARFGLGKADIILTGLPFSTLEPGLGARIADASVAALEAGGVFAAYQMRRSIAELLKTRFDRVRSAREWRNIPPCHLYWASGPVRR
jgi:phospholipid N-methyltransferase